MKSCSIFIEKHYEIIESHYEYDSIMGKVKHGTTLDREFTGYDVQFKICESEKDSVCKDFFFALDELPASPGHFYKFEAGETDGDIPLILKEMGELLLAQ